MAEPAAPDVCHAPNIRPNGTTSEISRQIQCPTPNHLDDEDTGEAYEVIYSVPLIPHARGRESCGPALSTGDLL